MAAIAVIQQLLNGERTVDEQKKELPPSQKVAFFLKKKWEKELQEMKERISTNNRRGCRRSGR